MIDIHFGAAAEQETLFAMSEHWNMSQSLIIKGGLKQMMNQTFVSFFYFPTEMFLDRVWSEALK